MMQPFSGIQLSGTIKAGQKEEYILSAMARRAYVFDSQGHCRHSAEKDNFVMEIERYEPGSELVKTEFELYPFKPYTDVIIKGSAHNHDNKKSFQAAVAVGKNKPFVLQVHGPRHAALNGSDQIIFSEPEKVDSVPLRFDYAYGGADVAMEKKLEEMDAVYKKSMPHINFDYSSGYRYPRNPCGKGYLIEKNKAAFEQLELPQLEHVLMPLRPDNLVLGQYENWLMQPLPVATDWVNPAWFPRIAYFGIAPHFKKSFIKGYLPEQAENWVNANFMQSDVATDWLDMRATNGAIPALQLPYLNGTEIVSVSNIHPEIPQFSLQLPGRAPQIWVDGRNGKLIPTQPVISTLLIDIDKQELVVIWRGSAEARRPYFEHELERMPYKIQW